MIPQPIGLLHSQRRTEDYFCQQHRPSSQRAYHNAAYTHIGEEDQLVAPASIEEYEAAYEPGESKCSERCKLQGRPKRMLDSDLLARHGSPRNYQLQHEPDRCRAAHYGSSEVGGGSR